MSETEQVVYEIIADSSQIDATMQKLNVQVDNLGKQLDLAFKGLGAKEGIANLKQINTATQQLAKTTSQAAKEKQTQQRQARQAEREQQQAQRQLAQTARQAAQDEKARGRELIAITKTFATQRQEINNLVKEFGTFNATLDDTEKNLTEVQQRFQAILKSDPQLLREANRIAAQGPTNVQVTPATFFGAAPAGIAYGDEVRRAGFALQRFGIQGTAAFGEIYAAAGLMGIGIGAGIVAVKTLTDAFKALARAGVEALKAILAESVDVAKEIELASAQFTAFFQGDEKAADAALDRLQRLSVELGENVISIGRAFLPEVGSLDQLEDIVKIAVSLARYQPEQGIGGARIALQEFLSGMVTSLQRRFEIPRAVANQWQEILDTQGLEAATDAVLEYLERTGRGVEALSQTWDVYVGRIREQIRLLGEPAGTPIIEEIEEDLERLNSLLEDEGLGDNLKIIAAAFGEIAAKVADFVGDNVIAFLEGIDYEIVSDLVLAIADLIESLLELGEGGEAGQTGAGLLNAALKDFTGTVVDADQKLEKFLSGIEKIQGFFDSAGQKLDDFKQKVIDVREELQGLFGDIEDKIPEPIVSLGEKIAGALGIPEDPDDFFDEVVQGFENAANEAVRSFDDIFKAIGLITPVGPIGYNISAIFGGISLLGDPAASDEEKANERAERRQEILKALEEQTDETANAFLRYAEALKRIGEIEAEIGPLEEAITEARADFQRDAEQRFAEIEREYDRARLEAKIDNARKLIDIEIKYQEKLQDILRQYNQKVDDAATSLTDKEEDIARKHGRDLIELDIETSKARLKAEEDYQEELRRIRDRFNFLASEAILANDAKRLREIRRQQIFEEGQAAKNRDRDLQDAEDKAREKREKLARQLEYEIEDAAIANERKLRDLILNLQRQQEEAEINRQRDIEAQARAEERKRDDMERSYRQQIDDYNDWWRERHRITEENIAEELAMYQNLMDELSQLQTELSIGGPSGPGGRTGGSGRGAWLEQQMDELRNFALNLAIQLGNTAGEVRDSIWRMTRNQLLDYIEDLQRQLGQQGQSSPNPRALGGGFLPGQPLLVGENGPELVEFNRVGRITPLSTIMSRPAPISQFLAVTNNTMNVGGVNFPDPRGIPPAYISMAEQIAARVVAEAWASRS
jgi:chemotaxis protein histidine kinase CheA